ncbi:MAG: competence/damage-inducible protein A [Caldibacillus sp.]
MDAEIIAVGSELLLGQITNTNARFLSEQLARLGINVYYHTVVGDNPGRLKRAIQIAQERADLIVFSGGLGPTKDDLTKEVIAETIGVGLEEDQEAMNYIEKYFRVRNMPMTPNNRKQANILQGATVLPNETGMAPGMALKKDGIIYMLYPGPPSELEPMFLKYGRRFLLRELNKIERIESRVLRFFGIGEALLEAELEDLIANQSNPTIAPLAGDGDVTVRLTAKGDDDAERKEMLDRLEKEILRRVGSYFYGYDDTNLFVELARTLEEKKLTLAVAESLTGGYFQEKVTDIPGASRWFKGGIVSYTNEVKQNVLNVREETLNREGAVSAACAQEMAANVKRILDADVGISFTGVAGPDPSEGKEPGTVFCGLALADDVKSFQFHFSGNREAIRRRAVHHGAWLALRELRRP